ncbi:hypothetical protein, partial [Salmonella enterica]|uniref:hypothetical protein n=1 Tax=Salmonella enterica TaxID=28901 RepID=UPI001CB84002
KKKEKKRGGHFPWRGTKPGGGGGRLKKGELGLPGVRYLPGGRWGLGQNKGGGGGGGGRGRERGGGGKE